MKASFPSCFHKTNRTAQDLWGRRLVQPAELGAESDSGLVGVVRDVNAAVVKVTAVLLCGPG